MNLPDIIQLPFQFNAIRLQKELNELLNERWIPHFNNAYYTGEWSVIPLRSINGKGDHIYPDPSEKSTFQNTPLLNSCPYIKKILNMLECEKESVRFMRLSANSEIKTHQDLNLDYNEGTFRLHIPIITNLKVTFYLNQVPLHMKKGECWYLNFNEKHRVINDGESDRIHLVIDCKRNEWTDKLFKPFIKSGTPKAKPAYSESDKKRIIDELNRMESPHAREWAKKMKQG